MRKQLFALTTGLLLLVFTALAPLAGAEHTLAVPHAEVGWASVTVDSAGTTGWSNAIARADSGGLGIAYRAVAAPATLRYAYSSGRGWVTETVALGDALHVAIAYNGDRPGIAYTHPSGATYDLGYAYNGGTGWVTATVDSQGGTAYPNALAVSSSGIAHITYGAAGSTGPELRHAYQSGSAWITETLTQEMNTGATSLALDSNGQAHLVYFGVDNTVRYTFYSGTAWVSETVTGVGVVKGNPALVLDGLDHPHAVYFNLSSSPTLEYAQWNGSWVTETVTPVGQSIKAGWGTSLALDADGYPHVVYTFAHSGDDCLHLAYAYWDSASWITETIDLTCDTWYPSLVLDALGRPHISYFSYWPGTLQYARRPYQVYIPLIDRHEPSAR